MIDVWSQEVLQLRTTMKRYDSVLQHMQVRDKLCAGFSLTVRLFLMSIGLMARRIT